MVTLKSCKNFPRHVEIMQKPIIKPFRRLCGFWGWKNLRKFGKKFQKLEKNCKFYKKYAKICNNKKTILLSKKSSSNLLLNAKGGSLSSEAKKNLNIENKFQKNWKKLASFVKNMLKFVILKCWNHYTTTKKYAVSLYHTIKEVPQHLRLKKLEKWQKFSKIFKKLWKLI